MKGVGVMRVFLFGSLVLLAACRSGSNVAPPIATPPASAEAKTSARPNGALPSVKVVLDDPRLLQARAFERAKDYPAAAKAMHDVRATLTLAKPEACAWDFVEGRLYLAANLGAEASAAFARADDPACPLASWARLRFAQSVARMGKADEAIAKARAVPEDIVAARDEVRLVIAESLSAKGDRAGALPLWRAWLTANPYGSRWVDTSVRIAQALLDGVDGPAETHAREAYDRATKVVIEAPKFADSSGATAARLRAVALLKGKDSSVSETLSEAERARQAQGWLEANEPQKAFELASTLVGKGANATTCKAALTRATATAKYKGAKVDAWTDAVKACDKDDQLVTALYAGAKAKGKDPKQAIEWFGKVEQLFPSHRLADDARFRAALLVAQSSDEGHEEKAEQMLRSLPDTYPSGDMGTEALFRVALAKMQKGEWGNAQPLLDRILEITPEDRHWATAGRAEYFRARAAAAAGDAEGARTRYVHIIEQHPLTFYMLMAHARLASEDPARAKKVLADAVAKDKEGTFPSKPLPVLDTPGFQRATHLLGAGEIDAAKRELSAAGALGDDVDTEVKWSVGVLYNQAGYPELGHAFSRGGKITDYLAHWPEGRWRTPWEVAYPRAFESLIVKAAEKNGIPQTLAFAIMREESSFVPGAVSHSNAIGLMQLIPPTAKWMASGTEFASDEASLKKPEVSIGLGTKLLGILRNKHGHPALAIGAYNGGSGAVDRWMAARSTDELDLFVELIPWDETRNYVKRVLSTQASYAYLYEPQALAEPIGLPLRFSR